MATLQSIATGDFTSSTTWCVVDATSFLDTRASTTTVTTTPQNSASFTPGAITVAGITLQLQSRVNSTTGTITVSLWNTTANAAVAGATLTIDVSDLPNSAGALVRTWAYFKFASPVTLLAATNYAVRVVTSNSTQVIIYTSAANNANWSRGLVTTTNAAPASTDNLLITGEFTGAGTYSAYSVRMDNTNTTSFGNVYVSSYGSLIYGSSASTDFNLRLAGNFFLSGGGVFQMGTTASPIPDTATASLQFNVASSGQYGVYLTGGLFETCGATKTNYVRLGADVAAGASSMTLATVPTGWKSGDTIGLSSTTRTYTQTDVSVLSSNVTTGTASVTATLTFAHGGNSTTLVQGHVVNLTRNVRIMSVSATLTSSFQIIGFGTLVRMSYTQLLMLGSANDSLGSPSLFTTGSSLNIDVFIDNCSMYQSTTLASGRGVFISSAGLNTSFPCSYTIQNNIIWGFGTRPFYTLPPTTALRDSLTTRKFTGNIVIRNQAQSETADLLQDFSDCVFTSNNGGLVIYPANGNTDHPTTDVVPGNNIEHYSNAAGFTFQYFGNIAVTTRTTVTFNNWLVWRNGGASSIQGQQPQALSVVKFDGMRMFGNNVSHISFSSLVYLVEFLNCTFWSGSTLTTTYFLGGGTLIDTAIFTNCVIGKDHLGNNSNHSALFLMNNFVQNVNIILVNPTISGTIASRSTTVRGWHHVQGVTILRLNGSSGDDYIYMNNGTLSKDTIIYKTSSPSSRLTPDGTQKYLPTSIVRVPVKSGQSCTISVWVRKSIAGDGSAYNGSQPNLIWMYNTLADNSANSTVATMSAAAGTWEQLSYTTPTINYDTVLEFLLICDGSSGWINVDEWDCNLNNDTRNDYILGSWIGQYIEPNFQESSGSSESALVFIS